MGEKMEEGGKYKTKHERRHCLRMPGRGRAYSPSHTCMAASAAAGSRERLSLRSRLQATQRHSERQSHAKPRHDVERTR